MLGAVLGLGFAAFFGINAIIVRRGTLRVGANYIATLTIFSGAVFFFLLALFTTDIFKISGFNWKALLFFALSGVVHFALGRTFGYRATQLLGATRSGIMSGLSAIVSILLAVAVLKETLTPIMVLGIMLSLSGPTLMALKEGQAIQKAEAKVNPNVDNLGRKTLYRGLFFGVGSAVFWGVSAIFIKLALDEGGSPIAGSFIAYFAASLVVSTSLLNRGTRQEMFKANWPAFKLAMASGMATNLAQMLRYIALNYGTVIIVSMASRTIPIWTIALSFTLNRNIESFSRWVLLGNGLLMAGTVLVLL